MHYKICKKIALSFFLSLCIALLSSETVKVGFFEFSGFHEIDVNGEYSGYGIEYLNEIAHYTGWTYEYVHGSWIECQAMLKNGEIDILGSAQFTEERSTIFDYSFYSSGTNMSALFITNDNDSIAYEDFSAFNDMTVGLLTGNSRNVDFEEYEKHNQFTTHKIFFDTAEELEASLYTGTVDAILTSTLRNSHGEKTIAKFLPSPFYFITTKGNKKILGGLNDALARIRIEKPNFVGDLYTKYYTNAQSAAFTKAEKEYIQRNTIKTAVFFSHTEPFGFIKDRSYQGIIPDMMKKITENTAIEFDFIEKKDCISAIDILQNNDSALIADFPYIPSLAKNYNIKITMPYMQTSISLLGRRGLHFSSDKPLSAALVSGSPHMELLLLKNYPYMRVVYYDSMKKCFDAVLNEEVDITFQETYIIYDFLRSSTYAKLDIITTECVMYERCIGVPNGANPLLLSVLNKSIQVLDPNEKNAIILAHTISKPYVLSFSDFMKEYTAPVIVFILLLAMAAVIIILFIDTKSKKNLKRIAFTDKLTGLSNWEKFSVDARILLQDNPVKQFAFVVFDIDKFRIINNLYGQDIGNELLCHIAYITHEYLSKDEICARMVSDEFILMLAYSSDDQLQLRLKEFIAKTSNHDILSPYKIKFSFGVYVITDTNFSIRSMYDRASEAKKDIKGNTAMQISFYNNRMHEHMLYEKYIEDTMSLALENEEFVVYIQPKYNIELDKTVGGEALVRWLEPAHGLISPDKFIPIFERNGFITKIDMYVFEKVCKTLQSWIACNIEPINLSVNLSRLHLHNTHLAEDLVAIADTYDIPHHMLELEITETSIIDFANYDAFLEIINRLKEFGFSLSLDDFGTGYSSLNILRNIPVDVIKIDREFFGKNSDSPKGRTVIASVITLAENLNMRVVAEGVETQNQVDFLQSIDCNVIQGYYYSKPLPILEFQEKCLKHVMQS